MILVYITNPSKQIAEKVGKHLLEKRHCACINIFPIESYYWWKSKIEKTKEWVLIVKTKDSKYEKIKTEVKKIHPYTIPCILKIKTNSNKEYLDWLLTEVK